MFLKYKAKNWREAIAGKQLNDSKSSDYVIKVHRLNYKATRTGYPTAFVKFHFQKRKWKCTCIFTCDGNI